MPGIRQWRHLTAKSRNFYFFLLYRVCSTFSANSAGFARIFPPFIMHDRTFEDQSETPIFLQMRQMSRESNKPCKILIWNSRKISLKRFSMGGHLRGEKGLDTVVLINLLERQWLFVCVLFFLAPPD